MARRLNPEEVQRFVPHDPVDVRYPWDEWLDGEWWLVTKDVDFHVTMKTFENTIYRIKRKRGRIKLRRIDDVTYILKSLEKDECNAD